LFLNKIHHGKVQILILAFPMVLVGTALVGVAGYYILPYQSETPELYGPWYVYDRASIILSSSHQYRQSVIRLRRPSSSLTLGVVIILISHN
jgi:hypothetical protein